MSEANSVRVSLCQRTSFETAAALNMLVLLTTGQSLRNQVGYQQSQILRTDANVQDLVRLSLATGGGLPSEFMFPVANEALWLLLRAALRSTETAAATEVTGVTSTSNVLSGGSGNVETGVEIGDVVRVRTSGNVDVAYPKVSAINTGTHTVTVTGATIPDGATYKVLRGARMKNGTEKYYFDIEVGRLDVTLFELFAKCVVNGFSLTVSDQAITQVSFDILGISTTRSASATLCLGHTNPTAGAVLDALGVPTFNIGGVAYSAKSIGLQVNHNIRPRTQIGTLGGTAFSWGAFTATTRATSYVANWTEMDGYTGNTPSDMLFVLRNAAGQAISFSMPEHKWSDYAAETQGLNTDDYFTGTGQAYLDPTEAITMRVQRWA